METEHMWASPTPDYFQEAVTVLKGAMQAEQQFKRGATDQGAEAAAMYDQGLELLDLAIRSDRHVSIREQLQQKSADVRKKVRALKRRVNPADVEAARARFAGDATDQVGVGQFERTPLAAAPAPRSAIGLTPTTGEALDAYATPNDYPAEHQLGTPRTVQRSVALQQATAARHELFDSTASPQPLASGATAISADVRAQAEQRVFEADEARRRAEEALRRAEAREKAALARADAAERELVAARESHTIEIEQRVASEASRFEARLADEVAAARERGREEGITLSPRDRVKDVAAPPLPLRSTIATARITTLDGRGLYGVGVGEWKEDLLRRKLAAAQAYVAQLEQQLERAEADESSS